MNFIVPEYKPPSRGKIQKMLRKRFEEEKLNFLMELHRHLHGEKRGQLHLISDFWMSSNAYHFGGILAQYIDDSFCLQTKCLAVEPFENSHTSERIS